MVVQKAANMSKPFEEDAYFVGVEIMEFEEKSDSRYESNGDNSSPVSQFAGRFSEPSTGMLQRIY
jgi:hypothetical protein